MAEKKGGRGRENPAFQSSHVPRLREIKNTPSSPAPSGAPRAAQRYQGAISQ